jgi:hypothetical protein
MSAPLHAQVYSSLARSEDLVKSIDVLEPGLRSEARSAAMAELTASVALHGRARHQGNVARYGSVEGLRSREMLVLAAEVALTNGHYGLAREKNREFFLSNPEGPVLRQVSLRRGVMRRAEDRGRGAQRFRGNSPTTEIARAHS